MIHPQLLVAPVPSVSPSTHMNTSCDRLVLLYTGIDDLFNVQMFLKCFVHWKKLGLALGLLYPTLQKIEREQHERADDCVMEMLAAWLQQQDNVNENGAPSWSVLRTALKCIGENYLAKRIVSYNT